MARNRSSNMFLKCCECCGMAFHGHNLQRYCSRSCKEAVAGDKNKKPCATTLTSKKCLKCGRLFPSEGAHNRMCHDCRARPDVELGW